MNLRRHIARRRQDDPGCRLLKGIAGTAMLPVAMSAFAQLPTVTRPPLLELVPLLKEIAKGAPVQESRVKLVIPHLAENGHLVPLTVSVDSPMTAGDYVQTVYLLSEKTRVRLLQKSACHLAWDGRF